MGYTVKRESNGVTRSLFICMAARNRADDRGSVTEPDVYLPAGSDTPVIADRLEEIWGKLFNHGIANSK